MDHLSARQERTPSCIREWIFVHGEAPTILKIGRVAGPSSPSSVGYQLGRPEQPGLISRSSHRWRPCRISDR
ncbi:hypothetical protein ACFW0I_35835 [[Kitasatospora] papulosa]|uniref:LexA family protein n=1 Tax=[Kitasatospora] papulosa TaxID=1464011 RepID=UPI00369A7FEB